MPLSTALRIARDDDAQLVLAARTGVAVRHRTVRDRVRARQVAIKAWWNRKLRGVRATRGNEIAKLIATMLLLVLPLLAVAGGLLALAVGLIVVTLPFLMFLIAPMAAHAWMGRRRTLSRVAGDDPFADELRELRIDADQLVLVDRSGERSAWSKSDITTLHCRIGTAGGAPPSIDLQIDRRWSRLHVDGVSSVEAATRLCRRIAQLLALSHWREEEDGHGKRVTIERVASAPLHPYRAGAPGDWRALEKTRIEVAPEEGPAAAYARTTTSPTPTFSGWRVDTWIPGERLVLADPVTTARRVLHLARPLLAAIALSASMALVEYVLGRFSFNVLGSAGDERATAAAVMTVLVGVLTLAAALHAGYKGFRHLRNGTLSMSWKTRTVVRQHEAVADTFPFDEIGLVMLDAHGRDPTLVLLGDELRLVIGTMPPGDHLGTVVELARHLDVPWIYDEPIAR